MTYYAYDEQGYFAYAFMPQLSERMTVINGYPTYHSYSSCTDVEPPAPMDGYRIRWNGSAWEHEAVPVVPTEPQEEPQKTEEQLAREEYYQLKNSLEITDYIPIKIAEASFRGLPTDEMISQYSDVFVERENARARINELEAIYGDFNVQSNQ